MNLSVISPICSSIATSLTLTETKRAEESVKAGASAPLTAIMQSSQQAETYSLVNHALTLGNINPIPQNIKIASYVIPYIFAFGQWANIKNKYLKNSITFIHNNIGTLFQVASIVSSIALIYFGNIIYGLPSIIILSLGVLDRNGTLPCKVRQIFHKCSFPLMAASSILFGNLSNRILSIVNLSLITYNYLSSSKKLDYLASFKIFKFLKKEKPKAQKNNLTPKILKDIIDYKYMFSDVEINKSHFSEATLPHVSTDPRLISSFFKKIDWNKKNIDTLRKKLEKDQRYIKDFGDPNTQSDKQIIAHANHCINVFVTSIVEKKILQGEPLDYTKALEYLRIVANHLSKEKDDLSKTDMLLRIAVEGGVYCGPGKFEVLEDICTRTILQMDEVPFRTKILYALRNFRLSIFDATYYRLIKIIEKVPKIGTIYKALDMLDLHNYNTFLNLWGYDFGINKLSADSDSVAFIDPAIKLFLKKQYQDIDEKLNRGYTSYSIANHLESTFGTEQIPKSEFYIWLRSWIMRQSINDTEKEKLIDSLVDVRGPILFNKYIELKDGEIAPEFIIAMLFDMGIVNFADKKEMLPKEKKISA